MRWQEEDECEKELEILVRSMLQQLASDGLHLSEEGLAALHKAVGATADRAKLFRHAQQWDLRKISAPALPADLNTTKRGVLRGPVVLQLASVANIRQPSTRQGRQPSMLALRLSDGHAKCFGLEHRALKGLSVHTPPGTKLRIAGAEVREGRLLLGPGCCTLLGGEVMALVGSWRAARELRAAGKAELRKGEDAPPPFSVSVAMSAAERARFEAARAARLPARGAAVAGMAGSETGADKLSEAAAARFRAIFGEEAAALQQGGCGGGGSGGSGGGGGGAAAEQLDGGAHGAFSVGGAGGRHVTASDAAGRVGYEDFLAERQRSAEFEVCGGGGAGGKGKGKGRGKGQGQGKGMGVGTLARGGAGSSGGGTDELGAGAGSGKGAGQGMGGKHSAAAAAQDAVPRIDPLAEEERPRHTDAELARLRKPPARAKAAGNKADKGSVDCTIHKVMLHGHELLLELCDRNGQVRLIAHD